MSVTQTASTTASPEALLTDLARHFSIEPTTYAVLKFCVGKYYCYRGAIAHNCASKLLATYHRTGELHPVVRRMHELHVQGLPVNAALSIPPPTEV